ncbi:hypothetical protein ACI2LF_08320 [Kribbella sp. NPDC020789]
MGWFDPQPIAGEAHPAGMYGHQAAGTADIGAMKTMANYFKAIIDSEHKTTAVLAADAADWPLVGEALQRGGEDFYKVAGQVKELWTGAEADHYIGLAKTSSTSIQNSASAIAGGRQDPTGRGGQSLTDQVAVLDRNVTTLQASITTVIENIVVVESYLNSLGGMVLSAVASGMKEDLLNGLRDQLKQVGEQMDQQDQQYLSYGQQVQAMAAGVKWEGVHGKAPGVGLPNRPGGTPPGGPANAAPPGADPGADPGAAPGADPGAAAPGGDPGADPGAGPGGDPGGVPEGPELAGLPPVTDTPITSVPQGIAKTPLTSVPITPIPPVTPMAPLPVGGGKGGHVGGGAGKLGGGAGKLGGLGGGKPGGLNGTGQIPSVAKAGLGETVVGTGSPPSLSGSQSGLSGGSGGSAGGMPPPMMPPMSGAGAGSGGKPGNGSSKPNGRQRQRAGGPTPGVPDRLRGKSGQRGTPAAAALTGGRKRRGAERSDAVQILDEELWAVDTAAAEPQRSYRPAN